MFYRLDNVDIASTATDHPGHRRADLFIRTLWRLEKLIQRHQQAGRAEPALQAVFLPEPCLNGVELVSTCQAFDSHHLRTVSLHGQKQARRSEERRVGKRAISRR